jgi:hypothetical protein
MASRRRRRILFAPRYPTDPKRTRESNYVKDRNDCLKKIEQAIFKQARVVDAVLRQFPVDYREEAQPKIDQVKKIRLRAINELLGDGQVIKTSDE